MRCSKQSVVAGVEANSVGKKGNRERYLEGPLEPSFSDSRVHATRTNLHNHQKPLVLQSHVFPLGSLPSHAQLRIEYPCPYLALALPFPTSTHQPTQPNISHESKTPQQSHA